MHEITSITSGQKGDLEGIQLFDRYSILLKFFFVFSKRGSNRALRSFEVKIWNDEI